MSRWVAVAAVLWLAQVPAWAQEGHVAAQEPLILAPADRQKVDVVADHMICFCGCARQTVKDCSCGVADGIKRDIWNDLQAGKDPAAVVEAFVAAHGPEFRSMPQRSGFGIVAWGLPFAAILVAIGVIIPVVYGWTRRSGSSAPAQPAGAGGVEKDRYESRVEEELSNLD